VKEAVVHTRQGGRNRLHHWRTVVFLVALSVSFPASLNLRAASVESGLIIASLPTPATIIRKWAGHYGVDKELALRIASAESGLNCSAQNKTSSAGGLFQFIDATFLMVQKKLGKPQDVSKKYDCDENAQLAAYLISRGALRHWNASRPVWDPLYEEVAAD
jgi:soluble lytic murein transglycosylase-like protein